MNRPTGGGGRPGSGDRAARTARTEQFFRGLVAEMRRVTWPTRQEWISATVLTVALVAVVGLYTYSVDELFGFLFGLVHK